MKKNFTNLLTIIVVFCIFYNCKITIEKSINSSALSIEFEDTSENDSKDLEKNLDLANINNHLSLTKIIFNSYNFITNRNRTEFSFQVDTPPPNYFA